MEEKLLKIIQTQNLLKKGDCLGVAVSGGVDSLCLLNIFNNIKDVLKINIVAIHINHNIRGKESDDDQKFVEDFCKKNKIVCVVKSVDAIGFSKENKYTLEEGARLLRYKKFNEVKNEYKLTKIALAHHESDQAETILMHMFRGCGLNGLTGMSYSHDCFIEPLLKETKESILNYAKENKLNFCTDSTNLDTNYSRNYIRQIVLKDVEKCYPRATRNIAKLSEKLKVDEDFIKSLIDDKLIEVKNNSVELKQVVFNTHKALLVRYLTTCLLKLNKLVDIEETHINDIIKLSKSAVGKKLSMPHGVCVTKSYNGIVFLVEEENSFAIRNFKAEDEFRAINQTICVKKSTRKNFSNKNLLCDLNKIPNSAVWRKIVAGDRFTKFGGGTKTLNKFLTDKKISSVERKSLVVLASGNEVLVVPNVEISNIVKLDEKTKQCVEICLKD